MSTFTAFFNSLHDVESGVKITWHLVQQPLERSAAKAREAAAAPLADPDPRPHQTFRVRYDQINFTI
jgi:hypothetical protein